MTDLVQFPEAPADPAIVVETERWLVVRKPASMHTVRSRREGDDAPSLAGWLEGERPSCASAGFPGEAGLLQRLDYGTSGLVLAAKDVPAFRSLSAAGAEGRFRKSYVLVCSPEPGGLEGSRPSSAAPSGTDAGLWSEAVAAGRSDLLARLAQPGGTVSVASRFRAFGPGARRVACLAEGAEPGRSRSWTDDVYTTLLESLRVWPDGSLLGVASLARGFRHQIRAHFAWIGLPLAGDGLYGGREDARLRLHAAVLEFPDPAGGAPARVLDPLVSLPSLPAASPWVRIEE